MRTKQWIRDYAGRILGSVETDSLGNKIVRDLYGKVLGKYDKRSNLTKDLYGHIVARGDHSSMLITMPKR